MAQKRGAAIATSHGEVVKEHCLWKELSNEEIAYWIERAVLKFSTVVDHSLVPSKTTRSNPGFA